MLPNMSNAYILKIRWFRLPCKNIEVSKIHGLAKISLDMSMKKFVKFCHTICRINNVMFIAISGMTAFLI